jgi:hypothetical protein
MQDVHQLADLFYLTIQLSSPAGNLKSIIISVMMHNFLLKQGSC